MPNNEVIDYRFKLRRGLTATWTSKNDVLLDGEIGLEKDTGFFKVGDGSTSWNDLRYHVSGKIDDFENIQDGQTIIWNDATKTFEPGDSGGIAFQAGMGLEFDHITTPPTLNNTQGAISLSGRVADYSSLPVGASSGNAYYNDADGLVYIYNGGWPADGKGVDLADVGGERFKDKLGVFNGSQNITSKSVTERLDLAEATTFGSLSGIGKWRGGVLAPNGKIYGIPHSSTSVLEIDPTLRTATTFGSLSSSTSKWVGGVLAPNGKIYGIPRDSTSVLEIDPTLRTATTFGSLSSSADKWFGGVLAPNGKIYGIPRDSTSVLEIDPALGTATTFGSLPSNKGKWYGGVLAPNGKIYGIPRDSTSVLEIDPTLRTATTFGSLSSSADKWFGGVLAPNGKIYGIPSNSTSVLEIDPALGTATTFGSLSGTYKWFGGVLAPNGKIYGIPHSSTSVLEIDPTLRTATTLGSLSSSTSKWVGGVLAPNGKIYGIPNNSTSVLEISFLNVYKNFDVILSPFYNKF